MEKRKRCGTREKAHSRRRTSVRSTCAPCECSDRFTHEGKLLCDEYSRVSAQHERNRGEKEGTHLPQRRTRQGQTAQRSTLRGCPPAGRGSLRCTSSRTSVSASMPRRVGEGVAARARPTRRTGGRALGLQLGELLRRSSISELAEGEAQERHAHLLQALGCDARGHDLARQREGLEGEGEGERGASSGAQLR